MPSDGAAREDLRVFIALEPPKRSRSAVRFGDLNPLDEFPLVPCLLEDGERLQIDYDSSAIAHWLDDSGPIRTRLCSADGTGRFLVRLIEEAFDEFGLYLAHHRRWSKSTHTNNAAEHLFEECRSVIPRTPRRFAVGFFTTGQVRRMPYLFRVGPWTGNATGPPSWRVLGTSAK